MQYGGAGVDNQCLLLLLLLFIVVVPGKIVMSLSVLIFLLKEYSPLFPPGGTYWKGAAQIGCLFGLSGLAMAPFLFENWFRYRSRFCKMLNNFR